jgi:hypothetical protein
MQDPPKFTQIWIFWFENKPSGNPANDTTRLSNFKPFNFFLPKLSLPFSYLSGGIVLLSSIISDESKNFPLCRLKHPH